MKELQIIIKTPDDGNPLNMRYGRPAREDTATVGWKMRMEDGQDYGTYFIIPEDVAKVVQDDLREAVLRAFDQAMATEKGLKEARDEEDAVLPE